MEIIIASENNSIKEEILSQKGKNYLQNVLAAKIDGEVIDVAHKVNKGQKIELLFYEDEEAKSVLYHSCAHVLAYAVKNLFPQVKLGIGPAIKEGFYYDFLKDEGFSQDDLLQIEEEMKNILKKDIPFERILMKKEEAKKILKEKGEFLKCELLEEIEEEVSFYRLGTFLDLCKGPHIQSTSQIKVIKLLSTSGAYWRGDERREKLSRIYGVAFETEEELYSYIKRIEEAKERDHRKLGKELSLFLLPEEVGAGLVLYQPKGLLLRDQIINFLKEEHKKRGYIEVLTPHIGRTKLWEMSGHLEYYAENMFFVKAQDEEYVLKPMNCPYHILFYKSKIRSYRELPIKYFELGTVYRFERSGVLHGLLRVRGFTQDDAHIFCTFTQLQTQIKEVMDFAFYMLKCFGFEEYKLALSTRPSQSIGEDREWEEATNALIFALKDKGLSYEVEEGEGVFYGPKVDIKIADTLGRWWQGPTIQVDFNLPKRFSLSYIDADGKEQEPVMIHRVVLGSLERFIGVLIEHYGGAFPLWLSPVQVAILTISEKYLEYANKLKELLLNEGIRVLLDEREERIGFKISEAERAKIPYMLVIGEKEAKEGSVNVRIHKKGQIGSMKIDEFIALLKEEIKKKC